MDFDSELNAILFNSDYKDFATTNENEEVESYSPLKDLLSSTSLPISHSSEISKQDLEDMISANDSRISYGRIKHHCKKILFAPNVYEPHVTINTEYFSCELCYLTGKLSLLKANGPQIIRHYRAQHANKSVDLVNETVLEQDSPSISAEVVPTEDSINVVTVNGDNFDQFISDNSLNFEPNPSNNPPDSYKLRKRKRFGSESPDNTFKFTKENLELMVMNRNPQLSYGIEKGGCRRISFFHEDETEPRETEYFLCEICFKLGKVALLKSNGPQVLRHYNTQHVKKQIGMDVSGDQSTPTGLAIITSNNSQINVSSLNESAYPEYEFLPGTSNEMAGPSNPIIKVRPSVLKFQKHRKHQITKDLLKNLIKSEDQRISYGVTRDKCKKILYSDDQDTNVVETNYFICTICLKGGKHLLLKSNGPQTGRHFTTQHPLEAQLDGIQPSVDELNQQSNNDYNNLYDLVDLTSERSESGDANEDLEELCDVIDQPVDHLSCSPKGIEELVKANQVSLPKKAIEEVNKVVGKACLNMSFNQGGGQSMKNFVAQLLLIGAQYSDQIRDRSTAEIEYALC